MKKTFFLFANNIHRGGGLILLNEIIKILPRNINFHLILDSRIKFKLSQRQNLHIKYVNPDFISRFFSEIWLLKKVVAGDIVLSFGNLPPLFKLKAKSIVFLQNRYLVDSLSILAFPFFTKIRIFIEKLWLKIFASNSNLYIVQTFSMKKLLSKYIDNKVPIETVPFSKFFSHREIARVSSSRNDFLYVASYEPHKNHIQLIHAWHDLAKIGIFPSLALTLDTKDFKDLQKYFFYKGQKYKLRIRNFSSLSHKELFSLYKKSQALIFPSKVESFGLPLIEAHLLNIPILASELDFVRDIVSPTETFDPNSSLSIARAVLRYLGEAKEDFQLHRPSDFLNKILKLKKQ